MEYWLAQGWSERQIRHWGILFIRSNEMREVRSCARRGQDLPNHKIRWPRAASWGLSSRSESTTDARVAHAPNMLTTGSVAP
eukprot:1613730-Pyramimonas_sp.AAC.1